MSLNRSGVSDPFGTLGPPPPPAKVRVRTFAQYAPKIPVEIDGVVIGCLVHAQLRSTRVPGRGPNIPPNIREVTDRKQEGLNLSGAGWTEFAYDVETDTFTKYDQLAAFPPCSEFNP